MNQTEQREYVRDLARQVAEIAGTERNQAAIRRWRDVNALRKPDRAPVWCKPVGCWGELLPEESLLCQERYPRDIEREFRRALIKRDIGDDTPVEGLYEVPAALEVEPANRFGVEIRRIRPGQPGGAWHFDPPLRTPADFDKLTLPRFTHNRAKTDEAMNRAGDLLGDILPVRLVCPPPFGVGCGTIGDRAAELRGMTEMMMDMAAEPALMHRLMAYLRDAVLASLDQVEGMGLLTPNNTGPMYCADPIDGAAPISEPATCRDLWCHANSQEFDPVSPAMWEEFLLNYQKPILARFGLAHYGCCEDLTRKIAGVLSIPNLRIFVCSAWSNLDKIIEACGGRYVIMWRQKATDVVFPDDTAGIRKHLAEGARKLQGLRYQIVLRELQTLAGHADRLHAWTRLAIEAAEEYS